MSSVWVFIGSVLFSYPRGTVFLNEVLVIWVNFFICTLVFWSYRSAHGHGQRVSPESERQSEEVATEPPGRSMETRLSLRAPLLSGQADLIAHDLESVHWPALRFIEYTITASELFVALLSVYVQDPPAFLPICGYVLISLTNLYGLLLHYSLVSDYVEKVLESRAGGGFGFYRLTSRRALRVPRCMLGAGPEPSEEERRGFLRQYAWGSYIASNTSTLLNSWVTYLVALAILFYQQTFLFSSEPPFFVVFAGWMLIVSYSSFGFWITLVYWFPKLASRIFFCASDKETFRLAVKGLDVLSLAAKLSIVGSLSFGFVFRAEGRC